ncbi:MAG: LCP family protein [Acidimicrobiales bacterium]|nr:LCP family protein [Acidimicrobiales bacterium]MDG2218661.1 LCP family protein [Acidimicrobiales bacterium]
MIDGKVVLRRTWPQRFLILVSMGVIGAALAAAWFVQSVYAGVGEIGRVTFAEDLLVTDTAPGAPVNFLIIGTDSAQGIDPNDPIHNGREIDPRNRFQADTIALVRIDPASGQAWVMSIPRDMAITNPRNGRDYKVNSLTLVEGPELLAEAISTTFDIQLNHYVQLDFLAFRAVVDQLDGVSIWFDNPARDEATGFAAFDIPDGGGCYQMDGAAALSYVRSRKYEEYLDGTWQLLDPYQPDLSRIERQQDFVVLALERAIAQGARNITAMSSLIESGAESVVLDQGLTPAELIDLGAAFTDFDPDALHRFSLVVVPVDDRDGLTSILEPVEGANEEIFEIFRGVADGVTPAEVRLAVVGADLVQVEAVAAILQDEAGFGVTGHRQLVVDAETTVIVHPPGLERGARLLAQYLDPVPAIVEEPTATGITLVLGSDHNEVSYLFPRDLQSTLKAVQDHGTVTLPDLAATSTSSPPTVTTTTVVAASDTSTTAAPTSVTPTTTLSPTTVPSTTVLPTTVLPTTVPSTTVSPTTTAESTRGRPPVGQSCG